MTKELLKEIENNYWNEKADPIDMTEVFDLANSALEQPCEDSISREETLKVMCDNCPMYNCVCRCSSYRHIERMASVTPQQKIGKWIPMGEGFSPYKCSECEAVEFKKSNYCPDCGIKMEVEE